MHVAAAVLATIFVILLVVVAPARGKRRYAMLVEQVRTNPRARARFYVRGIVAQWIAVGLVGVVGLLASRGPASIRLTLHHTRSSWSSFALVMTVVLVLAVGFSVLAFRKSGPETINRIRKQVRGFVELIPRSTEERRTFMAVAVTAGICEEIIFRGFGISYVKWLLPGANSLVVILIIGAAFGVAHSYQGRRNVVVTGVLGGLLAWITILSGTLLPAMAIHFAIDLRPAFLPASITEPYQPAEPDSDATHRQ
jgi:uncharacterized protein